MHRGYRTFDLQPPPHVPLFLCFLLSSETGIISQSILVQKLRAIRISSQEHAVQTCSQPFLLKLTIVVHHRCEWARGFEHQTRKLKRSVSKNPKSHFWQNICITCTHLINNVSYQRKNHDG